MCRKLKTYRFVISSGEQHHLTVVSKLLLQFDRLLAESLRVNHHIGLVENEHVDLLDIKNVPEPKHPIYSGKDERESRG